MTDYQSDIHQSIQWRCARMEEHIEVDPGHGTRLRPCSFCYSVFITSVRIPYTPVVQWYDPLVKQSGGQAST